MKDREIEDGEIKSGLIFCHGCDSRYKVLNFIPRFVQTDDYVDTFSFEWNKFYDVQIDILNNTDESERTFIEKTGLTPEQVKGKLILDAGIGAGRYAEIVSRWGGEVIGIDLSFAVDAAYKNIGRRPNAHIIQADIFQLPFKEESFDIVYCIGVLHHTPDTRKAFNKLIPLVKRSGEIAVFLYQKSVFNKFSDRWRMHTTRMSIKSLYYLSALAVPFKYIFKLPVIGPKLYYWFPMSLHNDPRYRWLDTFDWYAPKYQWKHTEEEVISWFEDAGLKDITKFDFPICIRGKKI
jgi:ubiquinone/menaquinone biosynthesis C-methylase UbiE